MSYPPMSPDGLWAPLAEAAKAVVAAGQADEGWPDDATITLLVTVRPDGHGRAAVVFDDLLDAEQDRWEGDGLTLRVVEH